MWKASHCCFSTCGFHSQYRRSCHLLRGKRWGWKREARTPTDCELPAVTSEKLSVLKCYSLPQRRRQSFATNKQYFRERKKKNVDTSLTTPLCISVTCDLRSSGCGHKTDLWRTGTHSHWDGRYTWLHWDMVCWSSHLYQSDTRPHWILKGRKRKMKIQK